MPNDKKIEDKFLYYWLYNLVGTNTSFIVNIIVTITAGLLYSFKVVPSPYLLLIFGVVSPIIFTLCLYFLIRNGSGEFLNEQFPKVFMSRAGNSFLMIFDICMIVGFALLIYFGPLNYFLFRFLQTVFFPGMLLFFLRVLHVGGMIGDDDFEDDL